MFLSFLLSRLFVILLLPFAQDGGLSIEAQAGFDGLYETSLAVPVVVTARNGGEPFDGEIRIISPGASGANALVYSAPLTLPTGADKRVPLVVYTASFGNRLTAQLVADGRVVAEAETNRLTGLGRNDLLYGVVSPEPGGLAFLETIQGSWNDAAVAFLTLDDLPEVSSAWDALNILILDDTDTSRLTAEQLVALRAWVESGGQLVVTGGPGGPKTAAGVADLLPVAVTGVESLADLAALGDVAGAPLSGDGPFVATTGNLIAGEVLIEQNGLPILARRDIGRGSVFFLALDPKIAPLSSRPGNEALWTAIIANAPKLPPWGWGVQDTYAASQAVSYIPGLNLPSAWQLFFFLLVYVLVIGPINYIILRRARRRELAWATIPALVLLFSVVTFATGFRARGNDATLNVMSVAFGSADADRLQTQSLIGLFSPRRTTYDLTLPYDSSTFPFQPGFGTLVSGGNLAAIERSGQVLLRAVRTDTSQIATFVVNAHLPRPAISAEATRSADGSGLVVTVRNGTADTLENAVILHGQEQITLGNLAPGEEKSLSIPLRESAAASPTPDPMFSAGFINPNPLITDPSLILGTYDYFSDPVAYPRWQLIQAHYMGEDYDPTTLPDPTKVVTLGGWLAGSAQEVTSSAAGTKRLATTLLLLEIPIR